MNREIGLIRTEMRIAVIRNCVLACFCYKLLSNVSIFINVVFFVLLYVKQAHCLAFLLVSVMKMCALNWCLQLQSVTLKKIIFVAL